MVSDCDCAWVFGSAGVCGGFCVWVGEVSEGVGGRGGRLMGEVVGRRREDGRQEGGWREEHGLDWSDDLMIWIVGEHDVCVDMNE